MLTGLFSAIFSGIIDMLGTLIQIACWPINQVIINLLPDLSDFILNTTTTINNTFGHIVWGLSILYEPLISTLILILTIEVAKAMIYISVHPIIKVWNLFQKVKFW